MITFGFKNKFSGWLRSITAIILGVLIVVSKHPENALPLVVKVLAAFLIAAGIVTAVYAIINRQRGSLVLPACTAVLEVVLGILLFVFTGPIASIMIILIGAALLVFGLWEIVVFLGLRKTKRVRFATFVLPIICALVGIFLICKPVKSLATLTIIAGIALLVYGVSEFIATWRMNRAIKDSNLKAQAEAEAAAKAQADMEAAKDADFEKVEEE